MTENLELKLLREKWVAPWQLDAAKVQARESGFSLWISLVRMGFLSEEAVAEFFALESGIPYIRIGDYRIEQPVLRLVDEHFSLQNRVLPLFKVGNTLFVVCANPLDSALLDSVAKMTGLAIEPLVSEAHAILGALDLYWKLEEKNFEMAKFIIAPNPVQGFVPWRGAQRLVLNLPFELKSLDGTVALLGSREISGNTLNISSDASAVAVSTDFFLPKGLLVLVFLRLSKGVEGLEKLIELKGEIVRSAMTKPRKYLIAIKLANVRESVKKELLDLALAE